MAYNAHPEVATETLSTMYARGFSLAAIGETFGMTHSAVHYRLKRACFARRLGFVKINTPLLRARKLLLGRANLSASRKGLPFNLTLDDIQIPAVCPIFGTLLAVSTGRGRSANSPSLDRIIPALGYTRGNVWVISLRANRIKNDASVDELQILVNALKSKLTEVSNGR